MDISLGPGRYVIAVSGGVDSMALLHLVSNMAGVELIVAHYDHGIRPDSNIDRQMVQAVAEKSQLIFEFSEGNLGPTVSEATARKARYAYLDSIKIKYSASAIITAHHQDDVLETAILNLSRGTGWRGLIALNDNAQFKRPLLGKSKAEILDFAKANNLVWREDSSNTNVNYLRNYIRHIILPQFGLPDRSKLVDIVNNLRLTGAELDDSLEQLLQVACQENELDRIAIRDLPNNVTQEILIAWWRQNGFYGYESKTLNRSLNNIQAKKSGAIVPLKGQLEMTVNRTKLALILRER